MSVTKKGIQGYEYQYKITALLSLIVPNNQAKLFVEILNSEDATLILETENEKQKIEIQVKKEKSNLNISKLIEWLCHFDNKKTDRNLLEKLIQNKKNTIALFVTYSRCSDTILSLKKDFKNYTAHKKISIGKDFKDEFNKVLQKISLPAWKNLKTKRQLFCNKQTANFKTIKNLKDILKQVVIWEQITDDIVNNEVKSILNLKYQIPQSKTNNVYLNLLEIVRKGRDESIDILPLVNELVQKNKSRQPKIDDQYKIRNEENNLINKLKDENILLLTGNSLCGKSETAKSVANIFFYNGYNYNISSNIDDVTRFFETNKNEKKIAILEDPWGYIKINNDFLEIKNKIEKLIRNLENEYKLIITSRIEILLNVFDTYNLDSCDLLDHTWFDLTIKDIDLINNFFLEIANRKSLPKTFIDKFSNGLLQSKKENLLQIGQLLYIVSKDKSDIIGKTFQELEHIARYNAQEIAIDIKRKDPFYAKVLSILSLSATTIEPTTLDDIGFVFSTDQNLYSIINEKLIHSSLNTKENNYPKYENDYSNLNKDLSNSLEYLEDKQLIIIDNNEIIFRHPNYYEAGRYLFKSKSSLSQKDFFIHYKKTLSCINPKTTFLASKQFPFVYKVLEQKYKTEIINLAFLGLKSIYPATEDNSLVFLINILDELDDKKTEEIIRKIQNGGTETSQIFWHNNIPYISDKGSFFHHLLIKINKEKLDKIALKLTNNKIVPVYDAFVYLEKLRFEENIKINYSIFRTLLKYNESFIRKKVAFLAISHYKNLNKEILEYIFNDEHPSVVFNAIRATFLKWTKFSKPKQQALFTLIQKSLQNKSIAIRTFNLITTFSIDYGHEGLFNLREINEEDKKELWNLWVDLFPIVFNIVPKDTSNNTARFSASMTDAFKYIKADKGIKVLESWYQRIDFLIKNQKYLDEFEMSVALELMKLTGKNYKSRKEIFNKLINYQDTNFILSSLKWIIEYWDNLDISEKEKIFKLLKSNRKDVRWIKAVLLTSNNPPNEIIYKILGENNLFNQNIEYIISKFPSQLLRDCLNVYCGFPQPLWWLAIHHKNNKFWNKVIRYIMLNEEKPGFDICVQEFTSWGVNGFTEEWKNGEVFWEKVCKNTKNKYILTENLIYETASSTCNLTTTKKLWDILIGSYSEIDKEKEIVSIIVENFEVLQQTGHKEDLFEIFEKEFLLKKIIPELNPDSLLLNTLQLIENNQFFDYDEKVKIALPVIEISNKMNIRFFGTFNYFKRLEEQKEIPIEIITELKKITNNIDDIGKKKLEEMRDKKQYELKGWVKST